MTRPTLSAWGELPTEDTPRPIGRDQEILRLVATSDLSLRKIGALFGISGTRVQFLAARHGIRRGPSAPSQTRHAACEAVVLPVDRSHGGSFWSKVVKTDCCWLWARGRFDTGYGAHTSEGRLVYAHRFAYELEVGPIPEGMDVMHSCDVRRCVRPDHLSVGTRQANQRDMVAKGRNAPCRGELNGHARLTEAQVREIRRRAAAGELHRSIAASFGTSRAYVTQVIARRTWAYLDAEAVA